MTKPESSSEIRMKNEKMPKPYFDLESRTGKFGRDIILLAKKITPTVTSEIVIKQMVKAGTSVGANYCEANDAVSKKDFFHKIGICKKETRESLHWLRMLLYSEPRFEMSIRKLAKEARELNLIFGAIGRSNA